MLNEQNYLPPYDISTNPHAPKLSGLYMSNNTMTHNPM